MKRFNFVAAWNRFWFLEQPATPIAIFRILFGLSLLQVFITELLPNFLYFYGVRAITDSSAITVYGWHDFPRFDLFLLLPQSDVFRLALFFLFILAAFFLTIGLFTRASAVGVYFALMTLHNQCAYVTDGGDGMARLVAFILCFSPCGEEFSLDRYLAKKRKKAGTEDEPEKRLYKPWAQRLLQIQLTMVYWHSFANKIVGVVWQNGTAVYLSTRMTDLIRHPIPPFLDNLFVSRCLTYYTLIIELLLFTLVWFKPLRYWVLLGGTILHLGIEWTFNLPAFELFFIACYINFVEPADIEKVIGWLKARAGKFFSLITAK